MRVGVARIQVAVIPVYGSLTVRFEYFYVSMTVSAVLSCWRCCNWAM